MPDARAWVAEHGPALVGGPFDRAARAVDAAALRARPVRPGEAVTLEFRPDRVTLLVDDDGRVTDVRAG